jgi:hypothetical protein
MSFATAYLENRLSWWHETWLTASEAAQFAAAKYEPS